MQVRALHPPRGHRRAQGEALAVVALGRVQPVRERDVRRRAVPPLHARERNDAIGAQGHLHVPLLVVIGAVPPAAPGEEPEREDDPLRDTGPGVVHDAQVHAVERGAEDRAEQGRRITVRPRADGHMALDTRQIARDIGRQGGAQFRRGREALGRDG